MAFATGPIPTETQFPCRTLVACLACNHHDIGHRVKTSPKAEEDDDIWKPDADVPDWGAAMETANKEWDVQTQVHPMHPTGPG